MNNRLYLHLDLHLEITLKILHICEFTDGETR